jgi:hypothetical protein
MLININRSSGAHHKGRIHSGPIARRASNTNEYFILEKDSIPVIGTHKARSDGHCGKRRQPAGTVHRQIRDSSGTRLEASAWRAAEFDQGPDRTQAAPDPRRGESHRSRQVEFLNRMIF